MDLPELLPRHLGLAVKQASEASSEVLRVYRLLTLYEMSVQWVVAVGAGELEPAERRLSLGERPSLGNWLLNLRELGRLLAAGECQPRVAKDLERAVKALQALEGKQWLDFGSGERGLLSLRNWLAHSGNLTEGAARTFTERLLPEITTALEGLAEVFATTLLIAVDQEGKLQMVPRLGALPEAQPDLPNWVVAQLIGAAAGLYLCGESNSVHIWPVFRHQGLGLLEVVETGAEDPVSQVFVRIEQQEARYAPYGTDAIYGRGGEAEIEAYRARLQGVLADGDEFWPEVQRHASEAVGRRRELAELIEILASGRREVSTGNSSWMCWLKGGLGEGKTILISLLASTLNADEGARGGAPVHVHLFQEGDGRCSLDAFVKLALDAVPAQMTESDDLLDPQGRLKALRERLRRVRATVICDGLDELDRQEPGAVQKLSNLARQSGGVWLFSSRPGLDQQVGKVDRIWSLPPMQDSELRALILELAAPKVLEVIVGHDQAQAGQEQASNSYLDLLLQRAERSPLWLRLYLEWLARLQRQAAVDAEVVAGLRDRARIPEGIERLYTKLVSEWGIGDLAVLKTKVLCLLVREREPLGPAALAELAYEFPDPSRFLNRVKLVERVLQVFAPMLQRDRNLDEHWGYRQRHESFGNWLAKAPELAEEYAAAGQKLATAAENPEDYANSRNHLYRNGIRYLADVERLPQAAAALGEFDYLHRRLAALGPAGVDRLVDDFALVDRALTPRELKVGRDMVPWSAFIQDNAHLLRRSSLEWGPHRVLHQLAWDHATSTSITLAAEDWSRSHFEPPLAIAKGWRPPIADRRTRRVLEHRGDVDGVLELRDGGLASWADDIRIWSPDTGRDLASLVGHIGKVIGALELRDGRLASWSSDRTVRIWNPATGVELLVLEGHLHQVNGAIELRRGRLASWSWDATVRIWATAQGLPLARLQGHREVVRGALELSDGRLASWSDDGTVCIWDVDTGHRQVLFEHHGSPVKRVIELRDGRLASWSGDGTVRVWSSQTGLEQAVFERHSGQVQGVVELRSGRLASCAWEDTVRIWDPDTAHEFVELEGHRRMVEGILELHDGRLASWSWDGTVRIWSPDTGRELLAFEGHFGPILGAIELRGARLASWSGDNTARIWSLETGHELAVLAGHRDIVTGLLELRDGRLASWAIDHTVRVWAADTSGDSVAMEGHLGPVAVVRALRDGRLASTSWDHIVRIWDTQSGRETMFLETERVASSGLPEMNAALPAVSSEDRVLKVWAPDGLLELRDGRLATWFEEERMVRIWASDTGHQLSLLRGHRDRIDGVLELRDGRLASWALDNTIRVWAPDTGRQLAVLDRHDNLIKGVSELRDRRLVSWSHDDTLRIWNPDTGHQLIVLELGRSVGGILEMGDGRLAVRNDSIVRIFAPDASRELVLLKGHGSSIVAVLELQCGWLASGSLDDTVRVWDPDTGQELARLEGHSEPISGILQLRDGRLASWSWDGTVRIWNPETGPELAVLKGHRDWVVGALELRDGRLASWSRDGTVCLWNLRRTFALDARAEFDLGLTRAVVCDNDRLLAFDATPLRKPLVLRITTTLQE